MNGKKITVDNTMSDARAWNIISLIDHQDYFIKYKWIKEVNDVEDEFGKYVIVDNYNPVLKDKKTVIVNKQLNPGALVGIDSHYYVRDYPVTAMIYGLYQIDDYYHNLMYGMKTSTKLNCVAERVCEHFQNIRNGTGLTKQRLENIIKWNEQITEKGASVDDVKKLETLLKFPITVETISGQLLHSGKYKKIDYHQLKLLNITDMPGML